MALTQSPTILVCAYICGIIWHHLHTTGCVCLSLVVNQSELDIAKEQNSLHRNETYADFGHVVTKFVITLALTQIQVFL